MKIMVIRAYGAVDSIICEMSIPGISACSCMSRKDDNVP
jgi:hypothetical protein